MNNPYQADIVFCLASQQAMPNVIPCLQDPPDMLVICTTAKFRQSAEYIQKVITAKGIQVTLEHLDDRSAEYYDTAWENTAAIYDRYKTKYAEKTFALNMTDGTKILATAATDAFRDSFTNAPIYYVGLDTKKIHLLSKDTPPLPITYNIKLADYFTAYGYTIPEKHNSTDIDSTLKNKRYQWVKNTDLLCEVRKYYTSGVWFEHYIFETLNCQRKQLGITDIYWGVKIQNVKTDNRNELDVAFIHNNTLYIIECKTGKPYEADGSKKLGQESDKILYKISAIKENLGAIASKSAIATIYPLDAPKKNSKPHAMRAKDLKIQVFTGMDLYPQNLTHAIKNWTQPGS